MFEFPGAQKAEEFGRLWYLVFLLVTLDHVPRRQNDLLDQGKF